MRCSKTSHNFENSPTPKLFKDIFFSFYQVLNCSYCKKEKKHTHNWYQWPIVTVHWDNLILYYNDLMRMGVIPGQGILPLVCITLLIYLGRNCNHLCRYIPKFQPSERFHLAKNLLQKNLEVSAFSSKSSMHDSNKTWYNSLGLNFKLYFSFLICLTFTFVKYS